MFSAWAVGAWDCALTPEENPNCDVGCNQWWYCLYAVSWEVEFGAPATLRVFLPRQALAGTSEGTRLDWVSAATWTSENPLGNSRTTVGYGGLAGGDSKHIRPGVNDFYVDEARGETGYVIKTQAAAGYPNRNDTGERTKLGPTRDPEMDLLDIWAEETSTDLALVARVADVKEVPVDHVHQVVFSLPGGQLYEVGYNARDGIRYPWAGYPTDWQYTDWVSIPIDVEITAGAPGEIRLVLSRSDLQAFRPGEQMGLHYADMIHAVEQTAGTDPHVSAYRFEYADQVTADAHWFGLEHESDVRPGSITGVKDPTGDVRAPTFLVDERDHPQLDLVGVELQAIRSDLTRLSLAIDDPDRVAIPAGYDAILYAAAARTADGDFMFGYLRDGTGHSAFCSTDTAVFQDPPRDPRDSVLYPLQAGPPGANSSGAAITFFVPHACLGQTNPGPVWADELAAASFLIEAPVAGAATVHRTDAVPSHEGMAFGLDPASTSSENVPAGGTAWLASPFGFGAFWDISGVVLALLLALGGWLLVARRRRRLHALLSQLDAAEDIEPASAREAAIREVGHEAKTGLRRGKLRESHYAIVMTHVDEALARVRAGIIHHEFGGLPYDVVASIQDVLSDGVITPREQRIVTQMVQAAAVTDAQKKRLVARVASWVQER